MSAPLVSIVCIAYNQVKYIQQALDGFLMQQTSFPIEILVNDDCSTDGTADVIREYETKYPKLFRCVYQSENQYSKGVHPWFDILFPMARGKYIALCEGDDYWTDPLKLQKQVDFLEIHPDYGFVGTRCHILSQKHEYDEHDEYLGEPLQKEGNWELFGNVLDRAVYGPVTRTNSLVFKNSELIQEKLHKSVGDYTLEAILASLYNFARLDEVCSVYRVHEGGLSNSSDTTTLRKYAQWRFDNRMCILQLFPNEYACSKEDIQDEYEYALLKCAIKDGLYQDAKKHRNNIKTFQYKRKFYYKYLIGEISFPILRFFIKK